MKLLETGEVRRSDYLLAKFGKKRNDKALIKGIVLVRLQKIRLHLLYIVQVDTFAIELDKIIITIAN